MNKKLIRNVSLAFALSCSPIIGTMANPLDTPKESREMTCFDKWCQDHYWNTEIATSTTFRQHDATNFVSFIGSTAEVTHRFLVNISYMNALRLYRQEGNKSYAIGHGISGALGYRILGQSGKDSHALDLRARYGHTIGNCSQQFALYDIGLKTYSLQGNANFTYGIGYRYMDYKTTGFKNVSMVYISMGINL